MQQSSKSITSHKQDTTTIIIAILTSVILQAQAINSSMYLIKAKGLDI